MFDSDIGVLNLTIRDQAQILERLNNNAPGFIKMLGGEVSAVDEQAKTCTMTFDVSKEFCHSVDIVQGGFITAIMDAAMSHAVFGIDETVVALSSLEIKTSYLDVTRAGKLLATGKVRKLSYKTAFLEAELYNTEGKLSATASSVAKISRSS